MKANPGIDMTIDLDDRFVDAAADGYDAVIRHGAMRSNRLIVKPLAPSRRFLVASPDYVERFGLPRAVDDLEQHKAILYTNRGSADWRLGSGRRQVSLRIPHSLRVNNGIVMRDAAIAWIGHRVAAGVLRSRGPVFRCAQDHRHRMRVRGSHNLHGLSQGQAGIGEQDRRADGVAAPVVRKPALLGSGPRAAVLSNKKGPQQRALP